VLSIEIPDAFARDTITREGEGGRAWINGLPEAIHELCERWHLVPDGPIRHGYVAVVLPVRQGSAELVLKVSWIDEWFLPEVMTLRAWEGRGAARLVAAALDRGALLLERLDPDRTLEDVSPDEATAVAGTLLKRLAIPAPAELQSIESVLPTLRSEMRRMWELTGRPFPAALLDWAIDLARSDRSTATHVIVNTDLHYGNVLGATREPWLAIDPKAVAGELEYGVAQLLWSRFRDLRSVSDHERRLAILIDTAGLGPDRVHRWAIVRIVEYWLWSLSVGLTEDPEKCRQLVAWLTPEARKLT
jgi:streptomycin 6-kinase